MSQDQPPLESAEALFDVSVALPSGADLEEIGRRARELGVPDDRVDALVRTLTSVPKAKIGSRVTRERADRAREQFTQAGLQVSIDPVLSLAQMVQGDLDGKFTCPACGQKVDLPENRQCPECGVFVDKVTDEYLLRKKLLEQERGKLLFEEARSAKNADKQARQQIEERLRAEIREELEREFAKRKGSRGGLFEGRAGLLRLGGVSTLVLVALAGGSAIPAEFVPWRQEEVAAAKAAAAAAKSRKAPDVDKMFDKIGPKAPAIGGANNPVVEVDPEDLLKEPGQGGGKGISVEQAVAAANALAASVGKSPMGGDAPPGALAASSVAAVGSPGGIAAAAVAAGIDPAKLPPAPVDRHLKLTLAAEFGTLLGEIGQPARSQQVLKTLKAWPEIGTNLADASLVQLAELEARAWSLQGLSESKARSVADSLMTLAGSVPDAADRVRALSRVGAIVARNPGLPPDAARAFLTQAAESLKSIGDPGQLATMSNVWVLSLGEVLVANVQLRARAGAWSRAQAATQQLVELTRQTTDPWARPRLLALEGQAWHLLGQADKGAASLDAALALVAKEAQPDARAALLRHVAQLAGAGEGDRIQAAVQGIQSAVATHSGLQRAKALTQLSILYAEAGLRAKAGELAALAQETPGLKPEEAVAVQTELLVRGDLVAARLMHSSGLYAQADAIVRRLGEYLL